MDTLIILILILMSALFSGLTIGMFTLDVSDLERKARNGNKKASEVLLIRRNGNMLLCTLLIGNSMVNSALSQTIGGAMSGPVALGVSTAVIFLFGELLPQAAFSKNALVVGYRLSWLMRILMWTLWPITKPLSFALDRIFGQDISKFYDREELKDFIDSHEKDGEIIDADERRIMIGAMTFSEKLASDVMTPASVVVTVNADDSASLYQDSVPEMFSRIPVWQGKTDNIVGVLLAKRIPGKTCHIGEIPLEKVIKVKADVNLDQIMQAMIRERSHMVCVFNEFGTFLGVVTMEDLIEQIMRVEIMDETDDVTCMRELAKSSAPAFMTGEYRDNDSGNKQETN